MKQKNIIILILIFLSIVMVSGCTEEDMIEKPKGTVTVSELLESPVYNTEVRLYGKIAYLGGLICPCFHLLTNDRQMEIWYDQIKNEGGPKTPVSIDGLEDGNWVIVTGELKKNSGITDNIFWAAKIEKVKISPVTSDDTCTEICKSKGYKKGICRLPQEIEHLYENIGPCIIADSLTCGTEKQCSCFCSI